MINSAYIQITTRCNMQCEHCCFSCGETDENGRPKGEHMTLETLKNTLKLLDDGAEITIGGGEPTIHPRFWEMFGLIMEFAGEGESQVYLATNGKLKKRAIALAALADTDGEGLYVALSQTDYHEKADPAVLRAFANKKLRIRKESAYSFAEAGRASSNGCYAEDRTALIKGHPDRSKRQYDSAGCCCQSTKIEPDGTVRQCGCDGRFNFVETSQGYDNIWEENPALGNVNDPKSLTAYFNALKSTDEAEAERARGCWKDNAIVPDEEDDEAEDE